MVQAQAEECAIIGSPILGLMTNFIFKYPIYYFYVLIFEVFHAI